MTRASHIFEAHLVAAERSLSHSIIQVLWVEVILQLSISRSHPVGFGSLVLPQQILHVSEDVRGFLQTGAIEPDVISPARGAVPLVCPRVDGQQLLRPCLWLPGASSCASNLHTAWLNLCSPYSVSSPNGGQPCEQSTCVPTYCPCQAVKHVGTLSQMHHGVS